MAFYSPDEVKSILIKLSQAPLSEIKFIKFERSGILVNSDQDEDDTVVQVKTEDVLLYTCATCKKQLASPHLLDLHVSENHDSYFDLQKEKKPMVSEDGD